MARTRLRMEAQQRVAEFVADREMDAPPAFRLLDLAAEVGELAADANESSEYGASPDDVAVDSDEIGDALFALLALVPPSWESVIMLALPLVLVAGLGIVPFVFRRGERAPSRRPAALLVVSVAVVSLSVLLWLGKRAPWSPEMDAWTGAP